MKLTATVVVEMQARSLREAGEKLDKFLEPAHAGGDVEVKSVELQTPGTGVPVTIPYAVGHPAHADPGGGWPTP